MEKTSNDYHRRQQLNALTNPDFAVDIVARRRKPPRNVQLEQFCNEGISIDMLRSKIVKQALQQGFSSRSRWLLQILGLTKGKQIEEKKSRGQKRK